MWDREMQAAGVSTVSTSVVALPLLSNLTASAMLRMVSPGSSGAWEGARLQGPLGEGERAGGGRGDKKVCHQFQS